MIRKELENIVNQERGKGHHDAYIQNALKEYLQVCLLYFIYTSSQYRQNLIFTGGTCLRHFYGLERLSVDLDFDHLDGFSIRDLSKDLKDFFVLRRKYSDVQFFLKQQESQILLKFPVLKNLGLARESESDLLYVKMDFSKLPSTHYSVLTTSKNHFGLNYAAKHYDLPSLMAGKLHAVLTRRYLKGKENRQSIKGRDYFDLLWFLKSGVVPHLARLSDLLGESVDLKTVEHRVDEKVRDFLKKHKRDYIADMAPLIRDPEILETYLESYEEEYFRFKIGSFAQRVHLCLICRKCRKEFDAGISIDRTIFQGLALVKNTHICPFCQHENVVDKTDYKMS